MENPSAPTRLSPADVDNIRAIADRLQENVERIIVGKPEVVRLAVVALLCEGHILLEDVPGIGKTTLARAIARSIGCSFKRIQFTPDLMPADITGINYYNQKLGEFAFREGPLIAQVVLADEVNRATPRTQSALLEAQLDRFLVRLKLGYPDEDDEDEILARYESRSPMESLQPVVEADELVRLAEALGHLHVDPGVRRYIVRVVRATRTEGSFELGASPRASLGLMRASRAFAAINGRDYVLPDDVKAMAPCVLGHRLVLSTQARLRGREADEILAELLQRVPVPVEA